MGCGVTEPIVDPLPVLQPSELCSDQPDDAIATFEDATLEQAVRNQSPVRAPFHLTCGLLRTLTYLSSNVTGIASLVGIQNLTNLTFLRIIENSITDISALSGLTNLGDRRFFIPDLNLDNNPSLTDIQPLLNNTGLGAGDTVYLRSTSVSCTDVAVLQLKGMDVTSDCP